MANRSKSGNSKSQDILELLTKWTEEEFSHFKVRESLQSLLHYYWENRYNVDDEDFDYNLSIASLGKDNQAFKSNTLSKYKIDLYEAVLEQEVYYYSEKIAWKTEMESLIKKAHALIDRKLYKQAKPLVDKLREEIINNKTLNHESTLYFYTAVASLETVMNIVFREKEKQDDETYNFYYQTNYLAYHLYQSRHYPSMRAETKIPFDKFKNDQSYFGKLVASMIRNNAAYEKRRDELSRRLKELESLTYSGQVDLKKMGQLIYNDRIKISYQLYIDAYYNNKENEVRDYERDLLRLIDTNNELFGNNSFEAAVAHNFLKSMYAIHKMKGESNPQKLLYEITDIAQEHTLNRLILLFYACKYEECFNEIEKIIKNKEFKTHLLDLLMLQTICAEKSNMGVFVEKLEKFSNKIRNEKEVDVTFERQLCRILEKKIPRTAIPTEDYEQLLGIYVSSNSSNPIHLCALTLHKPSK